MDWPPAQLSYPHLAAQKDIMIAVMQQNKFTMVCHPVGYHTDTFKHGEESLKNKICFINYKHGHSIGP